jgi:methionyl-tRNA formyltransferase
MSYKIKAVVLTANKLRHNYFTKVVAENFDLEGVIRQPKKIYYGKDVYESSLVTSHFESLSAKEGQYFGEYSGYIEEASTFGVLETDDINSEECIQWVKEQNPEVIFLFGTKILSQDWFDTFGNVVNLHLGLSPFYRGSATLFWPFVNQELCCVGATIHLAVKEVDAGPIIHQVKPDIELGDDYYEINYKTIKKSIDTLSTVTFDYLKGDLRSIPQRGLLKGDLYKKIDFTEEVLKKMLRFIGEGVTRGQLDENARSNRCKCLQ